MSFDCAMDPSGVFPQRHLVAFCRSSFGDAISWPNYPTASDDDEVLVVAWVAAEEAPEPSNLLDSMIDLLLGDLNCC